MHILSFADFHRKKLPRRRSVALCYSECPKCKTMHYFYLIVKILSPLGMHELLMKFADMRLQSDFSAKVFVLRSMVYGK